MTANQIAYWKLQEEKRSNLTDEKERKRHNVASEENEKTGIITKGFTDVLKTVFKVLLG